MDILKKCKDKRLCVAISGGVDSTALLHYLKSKEKVYGYTLCAVHCEHGIRGEESLADKAFTENFCKDLQVPLYVFSENCPFRAQQEKTSLETTARNFRYECFAALIENGKADYLATAHHKNDEAETVLFRLARGASLTGARGMTVENGYMLRPFLAWTRADILAYAKENGLAYCEDSTNYETDATRNKLRLRVLPLLEEAVPGAAENLARFASLAAEDDGLLYRLSERLIRETEAGYLVAFEKEKSLFSRAALQVMKRLGVERDYTALHVESAFLLQGKERGAHIDLPQGIVAEKTKEGVSFSLVEETEVFAVQGAGTPVTEMCFDGGRYEVKLFFSPTETEGKTLRVDRDKLPPNAVFRFRQEGDMFKPFGGGTKSLKKFLNEREIPVRERAALPLIAEADGHMVYVVCGEEICDDVKVTKDTQSVLYIAIRKK